MKEWVMIVARCVDGGNDDTLNSDRQAARQAVNAGTILYWVGWPGH